MRVTRLLQRIISLITRDESRHMGFGVLWIEQWMSQHSLEEQTRFSGRWLRQIIMILTDQPGPLMLSRLVQLMLEAGVNNAPELGAKMLEEQRVVNAIEADELLSGKRMPHLLKNARRPGLLKPEIVAALELDRDTHSLPSPRVYPSTPRHRPVSMAVCLLRLAQTA